MNKLFIFLMLSFSFIKSFQMLEDDFNLPLTAEEDEQAFDDTALTVKQLQHEYFSIRFKEKLKKLNEMEDCYEKHIGIIELFFDMAAYIGLNDEEKVSVEKCLGAVKSKYIDEEKNQNKKVKMLEKYNELINFFATIKKSISHQT